MKITFLGTSAGEEYPGIWCECENCSKARKWGGKNIRRNSSVILDGDVMVDMGKTAHIQADHFGIDIHKIKNLLVTHSHLDHLDVHTLWSRIVRFDLNRNLLPRLNMFGSKQVLDSINEGNRFDLDQSGIDFNIIEPYQKYYLDDIECFTLDGKHQDGESHSINYIITRKNRTFAYLLDTAYPFDETLDALTRFKYDFIIAEGTAGLGADSSAHMNFEKNLRLLQFFNENKLWKDKPDFYISHMSPHWCPPHDEYAPIVEEKGLKLAYDGLVLDYIYD